MILDRIKNFLPNGQFTRNVAILAGGTTLGQAILTIASPLFTRLYTPEDFGVLAVFTSIFSLLLTINSLRYELAIPLPESDDEAANILILTLLLVIATSIVFGLFLVAFSTQFTNWINLPALKPYLWLLLISLFGAGFYQSFTYWAIRKKAFTPIARTKLVQSLSQTIIQLVVGILGLGTFGLIAGYTLGQVNGSTALARLIWKNDKRTFSGIRLQHIQKVAYRYWKFPVFLSWASLVNAAGLQLPALILVTLYGPTVAGWYALGQRLVAIPMILVGTSIGHVYFSAASEIVHNDPHSLDRLFTKIARRLFMIGVVPLVFLSIAGPWLFEIILGEGWQTSGEFVQLMTPMFLAQFVVSTLAQTMVILERQDLQSLWDVTRLCIVIGVFVMASALHLKPETTIGIYSMVMCVMYIVLFIMNKSLLRKRIQERKNYE